MTCVLSITILFCPNVVCAAERADGAGGFRVNLPPGWHAVSRGAGHVVISSPDPLEYADVRPVLQRTSDCATTLRQVLASAADAGTLQVGQTGQGAAVARFLVRNGAGRGAVLCAETSRNVGMLYGAVVPANAFAREWPAVMTVLRSFAYQPRERAGSHPADHAFAALPPLQRWREPNEHAFAMSVPAGWQVHGGIHRLDATHYTSGVEALSPDGLSGVRIGDSRVGQCTVPGPGMNNMPPAQGSMQFCPASTAEQVGTLYLRGFLARDLGLSAVQIDAVPRADLARRAEAIPASFGLRVHCTVEELRFRASRGGSPVSGAVVVGTTLFDAVQGQNYIIGTLSATIQSFWGPSERFGTLARLTGAMQASMQMNPVWWEQTQRINAEITRRTLAQMHSEAQNAQQASWDRMAAADRRSESVGYLLSGTSRLSDPQGNTYEAKAGSNYYFLGANGTVAGTDIWPSTTVDLQQLAVIR
ncbi:MAG: hypothetical protein M3154_01570 [Candidatus Eremiobacteraeota bacterium]|nr:hypothetical protein [Candidatus Eremiobacteraeota bacterium]